MKPGGYGTSAPLDVPFVDVALAWRRRRAEVEAALRRVLDSGWLILGPEVEAFEHEIAASVDAPHAVGVASGTDAIVLALRAAGIGPGDEVLTVANAGVPTVAAIVATGARPRFVDIDPNTLLLDVEAADAAVRPRTRALVAVHLYGQVLPLAELRRLADRHALFFVEDCAQAQGAPAVASAGDVACFSFYPTKNVGAAGDAGACVTRDPRLADRLRRLRNYGLGDDGRASLAGYNSRLDEVQAAWLRLGLRDLAASVACRRRLAGLYDAALAGSACRPLPRQRERDAYHLYVVRCRERDAVAARLRAGGVGCKVHYPVPAHQMEAFGPPMARPPFLPNTEAACREVLSLPLYPGLSDASVERVVRTLLAA